MILNHRGTWTTFDQYTPGDVVVHNELRYVCTRTPIIDADNYPRGSCWEELETPPLEDVNTQVLLDYIAVLSAKITSLEDQLSDHESLDHHG